VYLESIISSGICPPQTPWHYNNLNAHSFGYCALGYFENASLRGYLTLTTLILILFCFGSKMLFWMRKEIDLNLFYVVMGKV
jgi:hypothetical protein